jgi:Lon protease-like protein
MSNDSLPLFPLSGIVLPDGLMPLRLFERRYIDMISQCLKQESGFGVCLLESGLEAGAPAKPYAIGCRAKIIDFDQGKDGLLHITAQGDQEFRLNSYAANESELLIGDVTYFSQTEQPHSEDTLPDLANKLGLILDYVEPNINYPERRLDDADWVCYRLLELLPLAPQTRFELLRMESNAERLQGLAALRIELGRK